MHSYMTKIIIGLTLGIFGLILPSHAVLEFEVTQGQIKPTPIAVTKFVGKDELSQKIADVISNDLFSSGLFILINSMGFNQTPESILAEGPRFEDWRMLNAQCLLSGTVEVSGGEVKVQFRLFDVIKGTELLGLQLQIDHQKWRRLAHMIADQVYHRITGEQGYFNTQVVFVEEQGPRGKSRVYRIGKMDYDGENLTYVTNGKNRVLSPRISPDNREIVYLAYHNKDAQIHVHDTQSKSSKLLAKFEGMSFAPRFSPDGKEILMSVEKRGTSAIYLRNVGGSAMTPLTQHQCIDTSPSFSPDQSQIVFVSDRGGTAQLYVMDRNGGNVNRISFGGAGRYYSPVWSPRGDLIVFVKQMYGQFYLGVIRPDGTDERLITSGYLIDSPAWAPNGRVIIFTKEEKRRKGSPVSKLWTIDLTGRGLRELKTPREASDGNWSQLLDAVAAEHNTN